MIKQIHLIGPGVFFVVFNISSVISLTYSETELKLEIAVPKISLGGPTFYSTITTLVDWTICSIMP